ncbi:hypothetical protein Ocin01_03513, partial [Orchesella cincta]
TSHPLQTFKIQHQTIYEEGTGMSDSDSNKLSPTAHYSEKKHIVPTERCGPLSVYVQGDLSQQDKRAIFLTVHDLGCNHTSFHDFVEHPTMSEIKERSVFIHVDVPGQEDNAP